MNTIFGATLTDIDNAVLQTLQANPDLIELSVLIRQSETFLRRLKDAIRVPTVILLEDNGSIEIHGAILSLTFEPEQVDYSVCNPYDNTPPLVSEPKQIVSVKLPVK